VLSGFAHSGSTHDPPAVSASSGFPPSGPPAVVETRRGHRRRGLQLSRGIRDHLSRGRRDHRGAGGRGGHRISCCCPGVLPGRRQPTPAQRWVQQARLSDTQRLTASTGRAHLSGGVSAAGGRPAAQPPCRCSPPPRDGGRRPQPVRPERGCPPCLPSQRQRARSRVGRPWAMWAAIRGQYADWDTVTCRCGWAVARPAGVCVAADGWPGPWRDCGRSSCWRSFHRPARPGSSNVTGRPVARSRPGGVSMVRGRSVTPSGLKSVSRSGRKGDMTVVAERPRQQRPGPGPESVGSAVRGDRRRRTGTEVLAPWPSLWRAPVAPPAPASEPTSVAQQWLTQAACRDGSVDMFPDGDIAALAAAQAVCAGCPVGEACGALFAALPPSWRAHGVWAGSTPNQRRARPPVTLGSTPTEDQTGSRAC